MTSRRTIAGLFVMLMFTLAATVMWQWRHHVAKSKAEQIPGHEEQWRPAGDRQAADAKHTITCQLDAYHKNDFRKAFTYESSLVRKSSTETNNIRSLIQSDYPQFVNFSSIRFGRVMVNHDGTWIAVLVMVTSKIGIESRIIYHLVRENGIYRVGWLMPDRPFHDSIGWDRLVSPNQRQTAMYPWRSGPPMPYTANQGRVAYPGQPTN